MGNKDKLFGQNEALTKDLMPILINQLDKVTFFNLCVVSKAWNQVIENSDRFQLELQNYLQIKISGNKLTKNVSFEIQNLIDLYKDYFLIKYKNGSKNLKEKIDSSVKSIMNDILVVNSHFRAIDTYSFDEETLSAENLSDFNWLMERWLPGLLVYKFLEKFTGEISIDTLSQEQKQFIIKKVVELWKFEQPKALLDILNNTLKSDNKSSQELNKLSAILYDALQPYDGGHELEELSSIYEDTLKIDSDKEESLLNRRMK